MASSNPIPEEPVPFATANIGSDEFEDPADPEEFDQPTHASVGATEGTSGSTEGSWEHVRIPDSPVNAQGEKVRAATAPVPPTTARATGSAMDGPTPPQVMSPSFQIIQDLEARLERLRKDVDELRSDDVFSQFAQNLFNQMEGYTQQMTVMQDQIERLAAKQPSTPETRATTSTNTWLVQQSHAHKGELDDCVRRVAAVEQLFVNRQEQIKRQRVNGPSEDENPDDTLIRLSSRVQQLETTGNVMQADMFMTKERMEQIDKHFAQISVRCIPSEKVEDRVNRSIDNLADQMTMRDIPAEKMDELDNRLTRSIANLTEQFQQFRARGDASTTAGRVTNAAVEGLEILINQARKDLEAQLIAQRQYVDSQFVVWSGEMHQHVKDIEAATTKWVADNKSLMAQKYEELTKQIHFSGPSTSVPSGHVHIGSLNARFDTLKEEINHNATKKWNN